MNRDRQLRGFLIAMLVGAGLMVLGQLVAWPPETNLERILTGLTVAVALLAVSLTGLRVAARPASSREG
ncbi:hypothetical protein [Kocuria arenosa]|uniref:hypothetical protein n=1 Tax=Kocuria arenosa TaxID=3071446 RepID=UPI0034D6CA55